MPLRYLRFAALDLAAWDACVAAAAPVLPYATAWWLRAAAGRWDAVVEVDAATGAYLSVLPLPTRRRPWGRGSRGAALHPAARSVHDAR